MKRYNPREIESKWQFYWDEHKTYVADLSSKKQKYIAMSMFNYPSGAGIHIGHAMNYTISDVMARFKRQQGYESYHPVGWDAFGLPAENYAIKAGVSPQESMATIIPSYHTQYKAMGWSNDWSKEIATHEPIYYKWTQWIFSEMYRNGLAYQDARMQWWCDKCQTVLANEQVIDGKCWRHDGPDDPNVTKREVKQWFFKITDYADELLEATAALDWTESVKLAQINWIGKSKGAEIDFKVDGTKETIRVFTTRPDTIFGATFLVVAPEHEILNSLSISDSPEIATYIKESTKKTEVERQASKDKSGVPTGLFAINPANGEKIPIWIADYVLVGYGTGAIMAVPAHDERDNEFAKKFDLPIREVVAPDFGQPLPNPVDVTGPVVIGYDPEEKQFMSLINTKNGMRWFAAGGLEENEDYVTAAYRELAEEAGFKKVQKMIQLGGPNYSYFYNPNKDSNRRSFSYMFLAVINKSDQGKQELEAHEKYRVDWSDFETILGDLEKEPDGRGHWIDGLQRAKLAIEALHNGLDYEPPVYAGEGVLFNSDLYTGMPTAVAREKIVSELEKQGAATERTNYKIRDWSVSRQRYWGAPIPIVNCETCGQVLVPDDQLPVVLPVLKDFAPSGDGRSALARAGDEWLKVECPQCGGTAERETDTLDTYICSSWYFLRYFDPTNQYAPFDSTIADKWMPIDFYNGGDHATAHMIYARFVTRFFHKQGLLEDPEPFKKFLFNGKVTASDGTMFSKSKGNGVDPLEIINEGYGADSLRTYLMFAAPLDTWIRWDEQGVPGTYRFLSRIWTLVQEFTEAADGTENVALKRATHPIIKKVTHDLEEQKYNTAIAAMMKLTNELYTIKASDGMSQSADWRFALESLTMMVAPFAPHIAEELWHDLGHEDSIHRDHWPQWDEQYLVSDQLTLAVQVNGKVRAEITVPADADEATIKAAALADEKVKTYVLGEPKKVIYVLGRLVSIVV